MGSSDTIKKIATSAITAGVASQINIPLPDTHSGADKFYNDLTNGVIDGFSNGMVDFTINGGSFEEALKSSFRNSLVDAISASTYFYGVKPIDVDGSDIDAFINNLAHKMAAAGVGCVSAKAKKQSCDAGALGAAVGEMVADYRIMRGEEPKKGSKEYNKALNAAKLTAGSLALIAGEDVDTAVNSAQVAVENNTLTSSGKGMGHDIRFATATVNYDEQKAFNQIQRKLAQFTKADNSENAAKALNSILYIARKSKVVDFVYFNAGGSWLPYSGTRSYAMNVHNGKIYQIEEFSFDSRGLPLNTQHINKKALLPDIGVAGGIGRVTYSQKGFPDRGELVSSALGGYNANYSGKIKLIQGTVSIANTDAYGRVVSTAVGVELSGSSLIKLGGIATGGSKGRPISTDQWGFKYDKDVNINGVGGGFASK